MNRNNKLPELNQEDALNFFVDWLRNPKSTGYASYGYGMYLPNVMRAYIQEILKIHPHDIESYIRQVSAPFYSAAWELCRRGILRPGIRTYGEQATSDGSSGNGYTLTPFGEIWINEKNDDSFVPTEPERFGKMLATYRAMFGDGYQQRAQEAIRCYGAHAYLSCCVMCGAAMESIILKIAIEKLKKDEEVLKIYSAANGRSKIENVILGQVPESIRRGFGGYNDIIKYWRDDAAHGKATEISDNEAFTSLALLLRFSGFVKDNWKVLTSSNSNNS